MKVSFEPFEEHTRLSNDVLMAYYHLNELKSRMAFVKSRGLECVAKHEMRWPVELRDLIAAVERANARYEKKREELFASQEKLEALIAELPETEREIIELRYFKGVRWNHISEIINYSERQIYRIHRNIFYDWIPAKQRPGRTVYSKRVKA